MSQDGTPYVDDMPLKGVRQVSIDFDVDGVAECNIKMWINVGEPSPKDIRDWIKERAVREHNWREMMTKKAQKLLDDLS
jgi:hypothetical protein